MCLGGIPHTMGKGDLDIVNLFLAVGLISVVSGFPDAVR